MWGDKEALAHPIMCEKKNEKEIDAYFLAFIRDLLHSFSSPITNSC